MSWMRPGSVELGMSLAAWLRLVASSCRGLSSHVRDPSSAVGLMHLGQLHTENGIAQLKGRLRETFG